MCNESDIAKSPTESEIEDVLTVWEAGGSPTVLYCAACNRVLEMSECDREPCPTKEMALRAIEQRIAELRRDLTDL